MQQLNLECKCPKCNNVWNEELNLHVDELMLDDEELLFHIIGRFSKEHLYNFLLKYDLVPDEQIRFESIDITLE